MKLTKISVIIALACLELIIHGANWNVPHTSFLFAPGILSTEHQVLKYCTHYTNSKQIKVQSRSTVNFEVINGDHCVSCNFAEIHHAPPPKNPSWIHRTALNLITSYVNSRIRDRAHKDAKMHLGDLNLGQSKDVAIFSKQYDEACSKFDHDHLIAYGTSRGSATIIHFVTHAYQEKSIKRVKAIVLEGCFDTLDHILEHHFLGNIASVRRYAQKLISLVTSYQEHGYSPLKAAEQFAHICNAHSIPVLIITSHADTVVPFACTQKLYKALQAAGLRNMYVLPLQTSDHHGYMSDNARDAHAYQTTVHAFYKTYGLSHDADLAAQGMARLDQCKIS